MFALALSICKPQDDVAGTVRIEAADLDSLAQQQVEAQQAERKRREEEFLRRAEELRREEEQKMQAEAERLVREEARRAAQMRAAQAAALEEERVAREVEEAKRVAKEARQRMEQERLEREQRVAAFLKQHGFATVNSIKRSLMSSTYPLHKAAELGDDKLVAMLLKEGAQAWQKNSSGKTAAQVAEKKNSKGSHLQVLAVLGSSGLSSKTTAGGA